MLPSIGQASRWFVSGVLAYTFLSIVTPRTGAQFPAKPHHSLTLEAQSVANGGTMQTVNNGSGSPLFVDPLTIQSVLVDRRVSSNRTNLKISVRNLGAATDNVRVEWFFVGLPVSGPTAGSHEIIFHHEGQDLAIPGGKTAEQIVSSPEVQAVYDRSATVATVPNGYGYYPGYTTALSAASTQKGLSIRGWMVRLIADDTVLAAKGSSQTYEEIAANPAKLSGMLARPSTAGANNQPILDNNETR